MTWPTASHAGRGRQLSPVALRVAGGGWQSLLLLILSAMLGGGAAQQNFLDKPGLQQVEDASESLANQLLDLSVALRQHARETLAAGFADTVQASPFPEFGTVEGQRLKWLHIQSVAAERLEPRRWMRRELVQHWIAYASAFSFLDDARFKVKDAYFSSDGEHASAGTKFFLVGRDHQNKRTWVKGTGRLEAIKGPDRWLISELIFDQVEIKKSQAELFSEVSAPAGVAVNLPSFLARGTNNFIYHGAAAGDLDQDGRMDIVATGFDATFLYLNRGDGTFQEKAWSSGLPPLRQATAPLLVDFDNDGDLDIFFAAVGTQLLFENRLKPEGRLFFLDISLEAGVASSGLGFSATAGDVNNDGLPDIYVTSYNRYGQVMPNSWHRATNGTPNLLFINRGDGTFKESAAEWGVRDTRWSYAAQFVDVNGDGLLDLYVANDFGENGLYINQGSRFEEHAETRGVLDPGNGMGVAFGDYNNDGNLDLWVTNMSSTAGNRILNRLMPDASAGENVLRKLAAGNSLYQGNGKGYFVDATSSAGPFGAGWAWGGVFVDFDNDGWQDLYSTSGFISGTSMKDT